MPYSPTCPHEYVSTCEHSSDCLQLLKLSKRKPIKLWQFKVRTISRHLFSCPGLDIQNAASSICPIHKFKLLSTFYNCDDDNADGISTCTCTLVSVYMYSYVLHGQCTYITICFTWSLVSPEIGTPPGVSMCMKQCSFSTRFLDMWYGFLASSNVCWGLFLGPFYPGSLYLWLCSATFVRWEVFKKWSLEAFLNLKYNPLR